jgi:general secretion pathway protein C
MWKRVREWGSKQRLGPVLAVGTSLSASTALVAKGALYLWGPRKPLPNLATTGTPGTGSSAAPSATPQQLAEGVLQRNIFDSETGPMAWLHPDDELAPAHEADAGAAAAPASGGRCGDEVRLFASIVNAREPERSLAALRKDGKTHLVPLGGALGDFTLAALYPTHAYLQSQAGTTCYLPVYVTANQAPPPPPPPPEPPPPAPERPSAAARRPPAFSEEELQRNIRVIGPQSYAVTKELFLRARQNPSGISRGTRFAARMAEGKPVGMEISKIRDDSLLAHLGLKKGDVVRRLNGFNLGTPDGVLEAFGNLSKNDRLSLTIERDGQPQTLRYLLE